MLHKSQGNPQVDVATYDGQVPAEAANQGVDQKLGALAATVD